MMAHDGILQKLSSELCNEHTLSGEKGSHNRDKPEADEVSKREKSRMPSLNANTVSLGQQSVQEQTTSHNSEQGSDSVLEKLANTQQQQTAMMQTLLTEFAQIKSNVASLNSLASEAQYDDVSDEESLDHQPISPPPNKKDTAGTQATASGSILGKFAASFSLDEKRGKPTSVEMADLTKKLFSLSIEEKKRTELHEQHEVPENAVILAAPKVNQEIWRVIATEARSKDLKSQKLQNCVLRAGVPIIRVIDELIGTQENPRELNVEKMVSLLVDSLALLSAANSDINYRRRDTIKRELNEEYQALCSQQNPVTEFLFGNNISDQLKNIAETNKVGLKVRHTRRTSDQRFHPHGKFKRRNPFLSNKPPSHSQNAYRGRGRGRRQDPASSSHGHRKPQN